MCNKNDYSEEIMRMKIENMQIDLIMMTTDISKLDSKGLASYERCVRKRIENERLIRRLEAGVNGPAYISKQGLFKLLKRD